MKDDETTFRNLDKFVVQTDDARVDDDLDLVVILRDYEGESVGQIWINQTVFLSAVAELSRRRDSFAAEIGVIDSALTGSFQAEEPVETHELAIPVLKPIDIPIAEVVSYVDESGGIAEREL